MYDIYITGNSYHVKDELKKLLPARKNLKKWWYYNYDFNCWQLTLQNSMISKKYLNRLYAFCDKNNLKLEIFEQIKNKKNINDFKTSEDFFDYFHKLGYSYSFMEKKKK